MGGAYLRSRIKQAGKWDQETIVSFFLCQYCSGEYLLHFSLVPEFDRPVIKVIDAESGQVIRQIPSEEILQMNKRLQAMAQGNGEGVSLSGLLFDGQV